MKKRYGACIAFSVLIGIVLGGFAVGVLVAVIDKNEYEWCLRGNQKRCLI